MPRRDREPLFWGLLTCFVLSGVGLAWWVSHEPRCGPGAHGKLWFTADRAAIVAYCDRAGRYVRPPAPLGVPSVDRSPTRPVETARLAIAELNNPACPPGVLRDPPASEGYLLYCDADTGELLNEPTRSQLHALSCGPPDFVKVITAENEVICRPLTPPQ